ncbi:hypothetical protein DGMP_06670 [Desulfomarina profundi]|uniref:Uncharacterized protein n=1 Tax=Desulfomarina profundi TaxID=2772557 RepID=A0A8D5JGE0_9BACT|nr:hypothetical protein [Desulfomarina profundi]BCL59974.1 hypothetical protein DGMP_06670 [Desulfomarina profundi]
MATYTSTGYAPGFPKPQVPDPNTQTDSRIKTKSVQVEKVVAKEEPLAGFGASGNAYITYALASAAITAESESINTPPIRLNLTPDTGQPIVAGSVLFSFSSDIQDVYYDRNGLLYRNMDIRTGAGIECGTVNYATGEVVINNSRAGSAIASVELQSLVTKSGTQVVTEAHFRTPGAPVRPGSLYVQGTLVDGTPFNATAAFDGDITGDCVQGGIDVETGIVNLYFGCTTDPAGNENEEWYDAANIRTDGKLWVPIPVAAESITFNCVIYSYLPLDADLIGIDPVRLPTDGRVPIVKKGNVVVIHNSVNDTLPAPLSSGQVITLSRDNVSLVELYDADGVFVPSAGNYTVDLAEGKITMDASLDLSPFTEPLTAMHRREDRCLVTDVQINGQLALASALSHDYPVAGTYVSSALVFGDIAARVTNMFDQVTWTGQWSDQLIGDGCVANYNAVNFPFVVTNRGAIAERWMVKFTSATTFDVIGENVGVIASGATTNTCAPINPATGVPYFTIPKEGWGSGWATGNILRFNTLAANPHIWFCRTTLSGPVTEPDDQFTLQIRGDAD